LNSFFEIVSSARTVNVKIHLNGNALISLLAKFCDIIFLNSAGESSFINYPGIKPIY